MKRTQLSDAARTAKKVRVILTAAQSLFSQFGLKKVTMDEIAGQAHVSKATVYKYFRNKNDIFDKVVEMEAFELLRLIREAVDKAPTVESKFKAHLLTRMGKIHDLINFYRVTQDSWGDFWPHLAENGQRFVKEEENIVRDILQQGVRSGELEVARLDLVAHLTVVALKAIDFPWALAGHDVTPEQYADMMIYMMMNGIRKR